MRFTNASILALSTAATGMFSSDLAFAQQQDVNDEPLAARPVFTSALADMYGKGIVISFGQDPNDNDDVSMYWQLEDHTGKIVPTPEPEEFISRFVPQQGPQDDTVFLRLGDFQFLCVLDDESFVTAVPKNFVEDGSVSTEQCIYTVEPVFDDTTVRRFPTEQDTNQFLLKHTASNRYFQGTHTSAVSKSNATPLTILEEKDVIPDLGFIEPFLATHAQLLDRDIDRSTLPLVFINEVAHPRNWGSFPSSNSQAAIQIRNDHHTSKKKANSRFIFFRPSRKENRVIIQDFEHGRFVCIKEGGDIFLRSYVTGHTGPAGRNECDFSVVRTGPGEFALFHIRSQKFVRRGGGEARFLAGLEDFVQGAEIFSLERADPPATSLEIIDLDIDSLVLETFPFFPDEIKTVKFSNDSPVSQEQVVELIKSKTVATETSWSRSFSTESTVSFETEIGGLFGGSTLSASLTVGFSSEQGKTFSQEETVEVNFAKTFEVPPCTDMAITISTSTTQTTSVPFIATIREVKADGATKIFRETGSQTGVVLDQTEVTVSTTPIEGCITETSRRLSEHEVGSAPDDDDDDLQNRDGTDEVSPKVVVGRKLRGSA